MFFPASAMSLLRAESPDDGSAPPIGSREHVLRILREACDASAPRGWSAAPRPAFVVSLPQLRASVTAYVAGLRREQLPPQTVLVHVKAMLREGLPSRLDVGTERELTAEVVRWCIEAYYDGH